MRAAVRLWSDQGEMKNPEPIGVEWTRWWTSAATGARAV